MEDMVDIPKMGFGKRGNGMPGYDFHPLIQKARLLVFDCDGVLFDSSQSNIAFFNHCLDLGGYGPLNHGMAEKAVYMSVGQLLGELFNDARDRERLYTISQSVRFEEFFDSMRPLFDFESVLPILGSRYRLAVASNRSASLGLLFEHFALERYFSFRVSALDAPPKPDPEMLLRCCAHFGVPPSETVYLGDSAADSLAAASAGTGFIGIGDRVSGPAVDSPADLLVRSG